MLSECAGKRSRMRTLSPAGSATGWAQPGDSARVVRRVRREVLMGTHQATCALPSRVRFQEQERLKLVYQIVPPTWTFSQGSCCRCSTKSFKSYFLCRPPNNRDLLRVLRAWRTMTAVVQTCPPKMALILWISAPARVEHRAVIEDHQGARKLSNPDASVRSPRLRSLSSFCKCPLTP